MAELSDSPLDDALPSAPHRRPRGWLNHPEFVYSLGLFLLALGALALAVPRAGGWLPDHPPLAALFFLAYGLFTISMGYMHPRVGYVSFDRVAQIAGILVLGPVAAAWVSGLASLLWPWHRLRDGTPLREVVTASLNNAGLMTLMILGCGLLYTALSGPVPLTALDWRAAGALLALILGMQIVNELLMAMHMRLAERDFRWQLHGFAFAMEVGASLTAVLVAIVINRMELPVVVLMLTVLTMGMLALKQFARMRQRLESIVEERTQVLREKTLELERLATQDQLTGLFNRRFADETLRRCIEEHERYRREFAIALIDLDHFKNINDQHSHEIGDEVLRRVSRLLGDRCRETDMVARYGGEEFLLCFPETDTATAAAICEQLRRAVESLDWSALSPGLKVSMSAGIAEMRAGQNRSELVSSADRRLYKAKHAGRNLVVLT